MRYWFSVAAIILSAGLTPPALAGDGDLEECKHGKDAKRRIAICTRLIESGREVDRAYFYRGMAYEIHKHDDDRAFADYSAAIRADPTNFAYYVARGDLYLVKGDHNRAIADYTEANRRAKMKGLRVTFKSEGITLESWLLGGTKIGKGGDIERAIAVYTAAITRGFLARKQAIFYHHRGDAYRAKGDDARALADHQEAIRLDPNVGGD